MLSMPYPAAFGDHPSVLTKDPTETGKSWAPVWDTEHWGSLFPGNTSVPWMSLGMSVTRT